ncbi:MAG TPA: hypothetical protein VJ785_10395 [Anaerolineales bacterium]|nr:hypothetical protein [Anaerolineales bacterium]
MNETNNPPEYDEPQVTNVSQSQVGNVQAKLVRMSQAAAEKITAEEVEMDRSAAADLDASQVSVDRSAIGEVKAADVVSQRSLIGAVQAERASVSGYTGAVIAQNANAQYSLAGVVIGNDVSMDRSRTVLLVSRNVHGDVTTLMDTRTSMIAGLVAGLFASISLLLGLMLFRRNKIF